LTGGAVSGTVCAHGVPHCVVAATQSVSDIGDVMSVSGKRVVHVGADHCEITCPTEACVIVSGEYGQANGSNRSVCVSGYGGAAHTGSRGVAVASFGAAVGGYDSRLITGACGLCVGTHRSTYRGGHNAVFVAADDDPTKTFVRVVGMSPGIEPDVEYRVAEDGKFVAALNEGE